MTTDAIALSVGVYFIGCIASMFLHMDEVDDGHRLVGRILFWPLFALKGLLLTVRAVVLDLTGRSA